MDSAGRAPPPDLRYRLALSAGHEPPLLWRSLHLWVSANTDLARKTFEKIYLLPSYIYHQYDSVANVTAVMCYYICSSPDASYSYLLWLRSSDIWLKQKAKKSIMIFWKVKAKVEWSVKVKAKEKSIDFVKSQRKVQWKMSKLLSIWVALWSKLWKQVFLKLKKMSLGRSQSHLTQQLG